MADILIRGVQFPTMPQAYKTLIVSYDGKVYEGVYPQPIAKKKEPIAHAVELSPHGDLIDISNAENALFVAGNYHLNDYKQGWNDGIEAVIENAPVVIPASKEETE